MDHFAALRSCYLDYPFEVSIETLSLCNAACVFCPYPTLERKGQKMSDEMLDGILSDLQEVPIPFTISPFKVNEPFLDKRLIPFCRQVNERLPNASLRLFTNGSPLTQKILDQVEDLERVRHLWVSLNEIDPLRYFHTMNLEFGRTASRLDTLHLMVEGEQFTKPVVVSAVDGDGDFTAYVNNRWPLFEARRIKRDGWLGYVEPGSPEIPHTPCGRWFELSIVSDGTIALCCMDGKAEFPIGHVRDGLLNVYNSPIWRDRRERLLDRHEVFPCSTCTY